MQTRQEHVVEILRSNGMPHTCLFRNSQLSTLYSRVKSRTEMTIITTIRYQGNALTDTFNANRVQCLKCWFIQVQTVNTTASVKFRNKSYKKYYWHYSYCRVYATVQCPSTCPPGCWLLQHAAGLLLWARQAGDIDRLLHGQSTAANVSSVVFTATVEGRTETFVVWPTRSCFADWSKCRHVTFIIVEWSTRHGRLYHSIKRYTVTWPCTTVS